MKFFDEFIINEVKFSWNERVSQVSNGKITKL